MGNLQFTIDINATKEKVWQTMLDDATYRQWTEAFHPGSYYEGSWDKGSRIRFLGPGDDGKVGGMSSIIAENRPYEFISIEHLGIVVDGVEDTTSVMVQPWKGVNENYSFSESDGVTHLTVDLIGDKLPEQIKEMFSGMWPKALEKLKELCEA